MARAVGAPEQESDPQASHPALPCSAGPPTARPGRTRQPNRSSACVSSASYIRRFGRKASAQGRARCCPSHEITARARHTAPHVARRSTSVASQFGHRSRTTRSEEHTSELQSRLHLVCRLLLEKKKKTQRQPFLCHHPGLDAGARGGGDVHRDGLCTYYDAGAVALRQSTD